MSVALQVRATVAHPSGSNGGNTRIVAGRFWGFDEDTGKALVEVG